MMVKRISSHSSLVTQPGKAQVSRLKESPDVLREGSDCNPTPSTRRKTLASSDHRNANADTVSNQSTMRGTLTPRDLD